MEKTSGIPPEIEGNRELKNNDQSNVKSIIVKYENTSIVNIKNSNTNKKDFDISTERLI